MGRSVSYPSNAVWTLYFPWNEDGDEDAEFHYEVIEPLQRDLTTAFASAYEEDKWAGREERIIASNSHGNFILCEYCGLCSLSFKVRGNDYWEAGREALAEQWGRSIEERVKGLLPGRRLVKLGNLSNGEGFYRLAEAGAA